MEIYVYEKKSRRRLMKYVLVALITVFAFSLVNNVSLYLQHPYIMKCLVAFLFGGNLGFFLTLMYKRKDG
jgi:hypothetical protein